MSSLDTIKSAKLDQATRLLRNESLENPDGTVTSYGCAFMDQKLWEDNRSAYAKELLAAKKALANERAAYEKSVSADEAE
jgi:hypothetical protein